MPSRLFCLLQTLLPHQLLSRGVYLLTRLPLSGLTTLMIRGFVRRYHIDLSDAAYPDPAHYRTFNQFFTRALRPGTRRIDASPHSVACPVDGTVSAAGPIDNNQLFQAKGHHYSLGALLGDPALASRFTNGHFATLYLSPRDYHRVHMPVSGQLATTVHVPGRLFSVNDAAVQHIPGLFARNERLVALFDSEAGPIAVILVGALFVSGIETVWDGAQPHRLFRTPLRRDYPAISAPQLTRGDELGRFNMGSTVIVLFGAGHVTLDPTLRAGQTVRMGQQLAQFVPTPDHEHRH
ncbi:MAG: phosphatidylserine decarboxylase [Gammaproteobacteria bacterium]|nr:phosphatidylserine decarboxylase [Gammaproteobacteria bacterium]